VQLADQAVAAETYALTTRVWTSTLSARLMAAKTAEMLLIVGMNKLVEEPSAQALAASDTENHFRVLAVTGDVSRALAILDRLDGQDGTGP
jgi:hypothetical protein